jgi:hypothetical protein
MDKFKSVIENFNTDLWHYHFVIEKVVAEKFIEGKDRRVMCTINESLTIPCALMHHGDGNYFINLNKEVRKKLKLNVGDKITFSLDKDNSEYGIPMPEEMKELLLIDDEANKHFHALTPGRQRSLLYLIGKPKNSATRLNKALAITEFLKLHKGNLDYKLLHQFIKEFNKL